MLSIETLPERIQDKIMLEPNTGCWLWLACLSGPNKYGRVKIKQEMFPAHKYVYEILVGSVPEGLQLDHLCRTRICVNPAHLEPVTPRENLLRGNNHNRDKTHCWQGHEYTEANTFKTVQAGKYGKVTARFCRECRRQSQLKFKNKLKTQ